MKTFLKTMVMFVVFLTCINANSQTQLWASRYTGLFPASQDQAWAIAIDNSGNSYVTGASDNALATIKYGSDGTQLWASRYTTSVSGFQANLGFSIAIGGYDDYGYPYIYATGMSKTTAGDYNLITIKYDYSGVIQPGFPKFYIGPGNGDDVGYFIVTDISGNCYVTGKSSGNGTGADYVTIKYDGSGNPQWTRTYNGSGNGQDIAYALSYSGGNIYVTGTSYNSGGTYDLVTIAYDNDGNQLWASSYPGYFFGNEIHNVIAADYLHGVYITGTNGTNFVTVKYNPLTGAQQWAHTNYNGWGTTIGLFNKRCGSGGINPNTYCYTNDIFVAGAIYSGGLTKYGIIKYDENGNEQWMRQYYNDAIGHYLGIDNAENVYLTGKENITNGEHYGTVKYDKNGNYQWDAVYSVAGNSMGLAVDGAGANVYVTGLSGTSNQDYATIDYVPSNGTSRPSVHNENNSNTNVETIPTDFSLSQNYPNPFNPSTVIKYGIPEAGQVKLSVYNMLGQVVAELVNENKDAGYYDARFDGSKLSSGVYVYKIDSRNFTSMKKMVLIK